ncbi:MAG: ribosomal protein S18-alanine N-acetyltransferase, partial [Clostridiales bacterium]|nr:ribosomal protein S18-alanine N-acetyltransferase [Clostridiales bacterium]
NIAVKEDYRRQGIGQDMLKILFDLAKELNVKTMMLEVRESNDGAIAMYEKAGFIKVGRRKKYYSDNLEDAIVMNKDL